MLSVIDSLKVLSSAPGLATHRLSNWGKWLDVQGPLSPLSKERIIILSPGSCQDNGDNVGKALDLCTIMVSGPPRSVLCS